MMTRRNPCWRAAGHLPALLLAATVVLAVPAAGPALGADPVRIGIDNSYPPYMYAEENGPAGIYYDLIGDIFERMEVPVAIEAMPWGEAVERTDAAEIGLGGLYENDERLAKYDYSDPILTEHLMLYVRAGEEFPFEDLDDLEGLRIGVNAGWSYGQAFDEARAAGIFAAEEASSDAANLAKLAAGDLDAAVVDAFSAQVLTTGEDLKGIVVELPNPVATNDAHLAFNKTAGRTELLEAFNAQLAELKATGTFENVLYFSLGKNVAVLTE